MVCEEARAHGGKPLESALRLLAARSNGHEAAQRQPWRLSHLVGQSSELSGRHAPTSLRVLLEINLEENLERRVALPTRSVEQRDELGPVERLHDVDERGDALGLLALQLADEVPGRSLKKIGALFTQRVDLLVQFLLAALPDVGDAQLGERDEIRDREELRHHDKGRLFVAPRIPGGRRDALTHLLEPGGEFRPTLVVNLDHARIIRLPEKTQTVIVGNPIIADVAVQKSGIMVVTAKSFGETNLIALDATGNMLAESRVVVKASRDSVVTVQRGMERESYACAPACQPAIQLGDNQKFFSETGGQATARNALAVPK